MTVRCVKSVLASSYPNYEIVLIDNASNKKDIQLLRQHFHTYPHITFIPHSENAGYAEGNNLGAAVSQGKYLVFLNNDAIVPSNFLEKPIDILRKNPHIAFLQPKIKWMRNPRFLEYAGGAGGFMDFIGYPFVRGRIFGSLEEDISQYDDERDVFWASGVALYCRKAVFERLGRFDPYFFTHGEEEDICFRAHRVGLRVVYSPSVEILHIGAYTGNRNVARKTFYNHRNHLVLLFKNLKIRELLLVFPIRIVCDIASLLYYLLHYGSRKTPLSVIGAYVSFFVDFPQIIRARRLYKIGKFGYPQKTGLIYRGSIIVDYFLFGKKRWSEIFNLAFPKGKIAKIF